MGVSGSVDGRQLVLGNIALMGLKNISIASLTAQAEPLRERGASVMYLAVDNQLAGLLAVSDHI